MKIIYRGSMPAPKHLHGYRLQIGNSMMTIEARTWAGNTWCYSGMSEDGRTILHHFE